MDWDCRRFDERRGGESYRPSDRAGRSPSRGYEPRRRSPPRNRSRLQADTWVPSNRGFARPRSRSPSDYRRRSRTPPFQPRGYGQGPYGRRRSPPRRFSPRRDDRVRSPPPSWRSRSPYSEGGARDASRGRSSPRRARDTSPGNQDLARTTRRSTPTISNGDRYGRGASPPRTQMSTTSRSQSPSRAHRGEHPADTGKDRLPSRSRQASPTHVPVVESNATSRRSSPSNHPERGGPPPFRSRSRSPANQLPYHRPSGPPRRSPYRDQVYQSVTTDFGKAQETSDRFPRKEPSENSMSGPSRFGRNIPTQPRNLGVSQSPPLGPSQGPRGAPPQSRGSHNASILSAPTRPRHGPSSRDGSWMGAPMSARRAPPTMPSHGAPSGPRASLTPSTPLAPGTGYRHPGTRQNSSVSAISSPAPRNPNFLAGLGSIIPGGRALPSTLDVGTEKRLAQLESDKEKLLDQMRETQRPRRSGLRDWDRLDRESSICALKSELAEGHLQRMADESTGGGIMY